MSKPERVAEGKFGKICKDRKWKYKKLSTAGPFGRTGFPDRVVWAPYETTVFLEWKRVGKGPTKLQSSMHKDLRKKGFKVYVVYEAAEALRLVLAEIKRKKILQVRAAIVSEQVDRLRRLAARSRIFPSSGTR